VERNPKAISTALLALLKNPDLRGTQGARGQQFVVENFDQNLTLDRYVALYEELGLVSADRKAAT
jgi:glycosyltransferase involved in cell wall biosynthesis